VKGTFGTLLPPKRNRKMESFTMRRHNLRKRKLFMVARDFKIGVLLRKHMVSVENDEVRLLGLILHTS
jgi:hypothetical protein